jgi:hypothetical protein
MITKFLKKGDSKNKETEKIGFSTYRRLKKTFKNVTFYSYYESSEVQDLLNIKIYIPIEVNEAILSYFCSEDSTNAVINFLGHSQEAETIFRTVEGNEFEYIVEVVESGANIELNIYFN